MKNKKKILSGVLLIVLVGLFFILPAVQALDMPTGTGLSEKTVKEIMTKLLTWLLEIVGVIAIIGFVVSGIMYLVSAGNDEMITKAKKYMGYCLMGIAVVMSSYVVVKLIDSILNATL